MPKQIWIHFLSRTLISLLELFWKNLHRTRILELWSIIYKPFWSLCKLRIPTVKLRTTLLHWDFFHGSSNFELELRQLGFQDSSIHHLGHHWTSVYTFHGQKTVTSSLHLQRGWFSTLLFFEIVICLLKVLPCWVQWNLNRGKWLSIKKVMLTWSFICGWYFARFFTSAWFGVNDCWFVNVHDEMNALVCCLLILVAKCFCWIFRWWTRWTVTMNPNFENPGNAFDPKPASACFFLLFHCHETNPHATHP